MKLQIVFVALAMALPMFAHATDDAGFFVDGSLGRDDAGSRVALKSGSAQSTVAAIDVGYRWGWLGLDLGYVDFSKIGVTDVFSPSDTGPSNESHFSSRENGFTLDVSGRWKIGDSWYYTARAGLYSWRSIFTQRYTEPMPLSSKDTREAVSWNAGLGIGYDFSKNFSAGLRYDWYYGDHHTAHPLSLTA